MGTTNRRNAAVAGFAFLFYIAIGIVQMALSGTAGATGTAAVLARMAQHATEVRVNVVLGLLTCLTALVLAATLHEMTRAHGPSLALIGMSCRVCEGLIGGLSSPVVLGTLWLGMAGGPDAATTSAAGSVLLHIQALYPTVAAIFFAVGSALFSWLFLRGRMVPAALAWLGVIASALLVVGLPLQLTGALHGAFSQLMWLPMAAFEIPLGLWMLIKGVASPP